MVLTEMSRVQEKNETHKCNAGTRICYSQAQNCRPS